MNSKNCLRLRLLGISLLSLAAFFTTSCMESLQTVMLEKDGSGQIYQRTYMSPMMAQMMGGFAEGLGGGEDAAKGVEAGMLEGMMDEETLKTAATSLGEGVTFVGVKEAKNKAGWIGSEATFAFKDINTLQLDTSGGNTGQEEAEATPVTFSYANEVLKIKIPQEMPVPDDEGQDMSIEDLPAEMMGMFNGMRFGVAVMIKDGYSETTATHHAGRTIILVDMDMGKMLAAPDGPAKLQQLTQAKEMKDAKAILEDIEGVKMEFQPEITVKVK